MDAFLCDLKHSTRMLLRTPGFTIAGIATLALGIAANTAIFSVVNAILLRPFAYPDPERIVMFQTTFPSGWTGSSSPTEFNWWRRLSSAFQYISAYDFNVVNLTGESLPEQIPAMRVSADFFRMCGAGAYLGRTFTAADDLPNASRTVVLAYAFWQRHFGADPRIVGRRMTLAGERYEIIGVVRPIARNAQIAEQSLGSGDLEIDQPPDVYLPFQLDPASVAVSHYFNVAARLSQGVTLAAANAQLQAGYPEYARMWPADSPPGMGFRAQPWQQAIVGGVRNSLLILLGAVACVLLIACANGANLLLARAAGRRREMAIRAAIGAGRGWIVRQLLAESVVLSLAAGALGLAAGYAGVRAILTLVPANLPRIGTAGANVGLDWRVFAFTLALSLGTGILFGLVPALETLRTDLSSALNEGGNRSGTGLRQNRTRALLVTTEMAFALVLLIGAALLIRSFLALRQVNPGFDAHNVLTMRMSFTGPSFERTENVVRVIREGVRRIRALSGVEVAATTCCIPLEDRLRRRFQIAGRPDGPTSQGVAGWTPVSAGYFETFRIPVLQGRAFTERDDAGAPVVIVNQAFARQFLSDRDPLKSRIILGDRPPRQILAVVADVRDDALNHDPRPILYELSAQSDNRLMFQEVSWAWVIRTRVAPLSLSAAIQKELRQASGGLPVGRIRTMEETVSRSTAAGDFNALVLTIFGCSALMLAAVGIYGLMAHSVAMRTGEIGVRLALGAESSRIRNMVVREGLRPAVAGVASGLAAAFGMTRLIAGFLFGVKPWDPSVFFIAPLILLAVALIAVWLPAMRASRLDPIQALRHD